jgi:hypothetical protein
VVMQLRAESVRKRSISPRQLRVQARAGVMLPSVWAVSTERKPLLNGC